MCDPPGVVGVKPSVVLDLLHPRSAGSSSLALPLRPDVRFIVKHFRSKKLSPVLGQNLTVLGDKLGLKIKFKFYNPKKAHPCVI